MEMSLTRKEFFRLLPAAVGSFEVDGESVRGFEGACGWAIRLVPLADRRLGGLALPRLRVEITLEGYTGEERDAFMERFRRGFLHGGG